MFRDKFTTLGCTSNCESYFASFCVYSGETDHVIPWQTDQAFSWRKEVVNAVEGLSKVVV